MNNKKGYSIASLVLGVVTWFLFWIPVVGQILPFLAIVFYAFGQKEEVKGKGMRIAGLVLGITSLSLQVLGFCAMALI